MGKPRTPGRTPARSAASRLKSGPSVARLSPGWRAFAVRLAGALAARPEAFVVLQVKGAPHYLQVATGGAGGARVEAIGDGYLPEGAKLGPEQLALLEALGWRAPTGRPEDPEASRPPGWSPNFHRDYPQPVPWSEVAELAVATLARVFGVAGPEGLVYQAMDGEERRLSIPELGLADEVPVEPPGPGASPAPTLGGEGAPAGGGAPGAVLSRLKELLAAEGYRPWTVDEEWAADAVYFKAEGRRYGLRASDADPDFVQVTHGYALDDGPHDELTLLRVGQRVQADVKVVKVHLSPKGDFVEFQAELFLGGHAFGSELLERCLGALRHTTAKFFEALEPEAPRAKA